MSGLGHFSLNHTVKENFKVSIRVNTNGHSSLIHNVDTAPLYKGVIDTVSISLNGVVFTQNTDDAGKVSVPLDLKAGTYKISASYDNVSANDTVKVLSVVTGKDITKTYKSTTKYKATFLDGNGAPLKNTKVKFAFISCKCPCLPEAKV